MSRECCAVPFFINVCMLDSQTANYVLIIIFSHDFKSVLWSENPGLIQWPNCHATLTESYEFTKLINVTTPTPIITFLGHANFWLSRVKMENHRLVQLISLKLTGADANINKNRTFLTSVWKLQAYLLKHVMTTNFVLFFKFSFVCIVSMCNIRIYS